MHYTARDTLTLLTVFTLTAGCAQASETGETGSASATGEATGTTQASETGHSESSESESESGGEPEPPLPETEDCASDDGVLFGSPSANTGLSADQCQPSCACEGGAWAPPSYAESFVAALEQLEQLEPPALLDADPYEETPGATPDPSSVCAVVFDEGDPSAYRLVSFDDESAAISAGGWISHRGVCGQCSSLANLAVYMRRPDLTDPVRECGVAGIVEGEAANIECLMELGFDEACAQIWYYNTAHTRQACLEVCLAELENPNHLPDGSLNPCIQCDEDESGDVFKAVSGRTRRNSGLPSALCRPCDSIYRVVHDYGVGG